MSLKKAVACIKKHKSFLITSHTHLEGDALGSELSFYYLLRKLGKRARVVNQDDIPYGYDFLPGKNVPQRLKEISARKMNFDCLAVLDCSDLARTGGVYKLNSQNRTVLNIDHHISNRYFADVNWVQPDLSCCCEMIYRLYQALRVPLDKRSATLLYVGLMTDTGSFRYTNTTSFVHEAVSELLKFGLDVAAIYRRIYKNIPFSDIKRLVQILSGIRLEAKGRVAWIQIGRKTTGEGKPCFDLAEEVMGFARGIKGVEVCVLFRQSSEREKEIRVNFRSQGKADVNRIAGSFGGGGHKTASGCTVRGSLATVRKQVLARIKASLK